MGGGAACADGDAVVGDAVVGDAVADGAAVVVDGIGVFDTVESPDPQPLSSAPSVTAAAGNAVSRCHTTQHGTGQLD